MKETSHTYPLPEIEDDPRFTFGLIVDVAEVLTRHGYPELKPADLVELQQCLFRLLYAGDDRRPPPAGRRPQPRPPGDPGGALAT